MALLQNPRYFHSDSSICHRLQWTFQFVSDILTTTDWIHQPVRVERVAYTAVQTENVSFAPDTTKKLAAFVNESYVIYIDSQNAKKPFKHYFCFIDEERKV